MDSAKFIVASALIGIFSISAKADRDPVAVESAPISVAAAPVQLAQGGAAAEGPRGDAPAACVVVNPSDSDATPILRVASNAALTVR